VLFHCNVDIDSLDADKTILSAVASLQQLVSNKQQLVTAKMNRGRPHSFVSHAQVKLTFFVLPFYGM